MEVLPARNLPKVTPPLSAGYSEQELKPGRNGEDPSGREIPNGKH